MTYLLLYLLSDGLWEGLAAGAERKTWEGRKRKGGELGKQDSRALGGLLERWWLRRLHGALQLCAGNCTEAGVTMQCKQAEVQGGFSGGLDRGRWLL